MLKKIDFSNLNIRRLREDDKITHFDCNDDDLNDFILWESPFYRKALLAVSYVVVEKSNPDEIIGFFSMANDKVALGDFADKTEFNRFRKKQGFPQSKRLKSYPAVKICRLAVSNKYKGMNLGSFLLDFIKTYFIVDNKSGCRFLTVDAYIPAISFYEKNSFKTLGPSKDDNPYTRLLFFDLNAIAS